MKAGLKRMFGIGSIIGWVLFPVGSVFAHENQPPTPTDVWLHWQSEPWIVVGLVGSALLYGYGVQRLWRHAGQGRVVTAHQIVAFMAALVLVAIALLSPLAAVSEALFSAHMVQHLLLMNGAAPLLVGGLEPTLLLWVLPVATRRQVGRWWVQQSRLQRGWYWLTRPLVVWAIYALTLWLWHAPRFYQAALADERIHQLEHSGFLASALLFWWILRQSRGHRLPVGVALLLLFTTALHGGLLAALITFTPVPLYPIYGPYVRPWGLTILSDQQLAGVVMWVPVGLLYLGALLRRLWQELTRADDAGLPAWQ